jgi:hypothetical protein
MVLTSVCAVHGEESGFRGVSFGHDHGIHLAAGPDLMHLMLEGLANVVLTCLCEDLQQKGVLSEINATLAKLHVRSHDENTKFTWVRAGLESLTRVCAEDMPGVLNSLTLALGTYERGDSLTVEDLMRYHRVIYLFGALHRNMKEPDHTEEEIDVSVLFSVEFFVIRPHVHLNRTFPVSLCCSLGPCKTCFPIRCLATKTENPEDSTIIICFATQSSRFAGSETS